MLVLRSLFQISLKKFFTYFIKAVRGDVDSFTEGSINGALFLLSIPMILEMMMEATFALMDAFYISLLDSEEALATIGLTETFMFVVMSVALGISSAATAMVSRRVGEEKNEAATYAGVQSIFLAIVTSVIMGVIGFIYAPDLLRLMGGSESLIEEGTSYCRIMLTFNIVLVLLFVINAVFRGAGNAAIAMWTLILANGLNIILDPCLIFGLGPFPELGLKGAAIATCIGRGTGVLFQLYHLVSGTSLIKVAGKHLTVIKDMLITQIKVAIGGAGQYLLTTISWILVIRIIAEFGSEALAGYTVAMRVIMFTILPSWGLSMAASTLVGQNLGAAKPDRAEASAWKAAFYNMIFLAIISALAFVVAHPVISIFSSDPEVISNGVMALRIICAGYIFYAYEMVLGQSFNGAGDTYTPTILNFIAFVLIQVPLAYFLAITSGLGPKGVYISIALSSAIIAIMAIVIFKRGNWKKIVL